MYVTKKKEFSSDILNNIIFKTGKEQGANTERDCVTVYCVNCTPIQRQTMVYKLTQVGDQTLWPVPAELVIVLPKYTELVCVVISRSHGSEQRK